MFKKRQIGNEQINMQISNISNADKCYRDKSSSKKEMYNIWDVQ